MMQLTEEQWSDNWFNSQSLQAQLTKR